MIGSCASREINLLTTNQDGLRALETPLSTVIWGRTARGAKQPSLPLLPLPNALAVPQRFSCGLMLTCCASQESDQSFSPISLWAVLPCELSSSELFGLAPFSAAKLPI